MVDITEDHAPGTFGGFRGGVRGSGVTVHQGVGADTLVEEMTFCQVKLEGEELELQWFELFRCAW